MKDPSLAIQAAEYLALRAALPATVGVYDDVPADAAGRITAAFPYVKFAQYQVKSDADQCHDPSTVFSTVEVFSRAVGKIEARQLMAIVCLVLDAKLDLSAGGFKCIGNGVENGPLDVGDTDPKTKRLATTFRYRVGPTA
jgi:hypothetical protein